MKKRNSQDFPASGLRWNVRYNKGDNSLRVVAKKGNATVTDEITQSYQTDKWGAPAKMTLQKIEQKGEIATLEVKLYDAKNILCLDARTPVTFGLTGDGQLIDNQGTSSGSRKVELYNGRAIIRVKTNNGKSVVTVKSQGLKTAFLEL